MQTTIKEEINYEGPGLHSGQPVKLQFRPAAANTGIVFTRVDKGVSIAARIENVVGSEREIILEKDGVRVHTGEHILAALAGLGIDNINVLLDRDEPPVGDGSALPFAQLLLRVGILPLAVPKRRVLPDRSLWVQDEDKSISILPQEGFRITYTIDFNHPVVGSQSASFLLSPEVFLKEIAPARTFGFLSEINPLREKGLFRGGNLENAVVLDNERILNDNLRFENELVRHKILDLIGDLSLVGGAIQGHIMAIKSGHALNIKFAERLCEYMGGRARTSLDINQIQKILPHRYPFLLVDQILELEKGKKIVGLKNVSGNESYFAGHYPDRPIMPGVLIIEAMAQVAGILFLFHAEDKGKIIYLAGIEAARFRRPVFPGDQLRLEVVPIRIRQRAGKMLGKAYVGNSLVAEAEMTFSLPEG